MHKNPRAKYYETTMKEMAAFTIIGCIYEDSTSNLFTQIIL